MHYALAKVPGGKVLIVGFISKAWQHTVKQGYLNINLENKRVYCPTLKYYQNNFCRNHKAFLFIVDYLDREKF